MEDNKAFVKRYIENMVSTGHVDELSSVISDDYVDEYHKHSSERGPEVAKAHIEAVRSTYPDLKVAEEYCRIAFAVQEIEMCVISQRAKLIDYYVRRGYRSTGIESSYPSECEMGYVNVFLSMRHFLVSKD